MIAVWLLAAMSPTVDMAAVGDIMLGRYVGRRIVAEGKASIFGKWTKETRAADLTLGNLECVLTRRRPKVNKQIRLTADPALAGDLGAAGFDALSVANNHAMDSGPKGLADTASALTKARMRALDGHVQWVTVKGIRIALLAFSDFDEKGVDALAAIRTARRTADVVVAMWHWGIELSAKVSPRQRLLAKAAAAAGADVVLGSHPHVLQPVEWIPADRHRRCLVAYSLGNFIFDARAGAESKTAILHVILEKSGARNFLLVPCRIDQGEPVISS